MKTGKLICFLGLMVCIQMAQAGIVGSPEVAIKDITFYSKIYPFMPEWSGRVMLQFETPFQWQGQTNCTTNNVSINPADNHLISAALAAYASGAKVMIYVDDSADDNSIYCEMTLLIYKK